MLHPMLNVNSKDVSHYNLGSRDKHFDLGEQALILIPDSTSHLFSKWTGPTRIADVRSPYSYTVELEDGSRRIFHANKLRNLMCVLNL